MAMEVPARKTKAGAQKWVIQRVKKSRGVVTVRSVGWWVRDQLSRKSRVWSSAMMTMTRPRAISMEGMRFTGAEVTGDGGEDRRFFDGGQNFRRMDKMGRRVTDEVPSGGLEFL